jgi:hypothetical protein
MRYDVFAILMLLAVPASGTTYLAPEQFVEQSFDRTPAMQTLWLTPTLQAGAKKILGHSYGALRIRYWRRGARSLWILNEIGKERPITVGVVVDAGRIANVSVLVFRESRGDEVRHPFFTRQFDRLGLNDNLGLSGRIDGITGATLSVNAVTSVARLALYFDETIEARGQSASD